MKKTQLAHSYKTIILIIAIVLSVKVLRSQEIQEIKITGSFNKVPLQEFFSTLEKDYGVRFFYKEEWIKSKEANDTFTDSPLIQVLNKVLSGNDLSFKFFQNSAVIITPYNKLGLAYEHSYNYFIYNEDKGYSPIKTNWNSLLTKFDKPNQKLVKKLLRKNGILINNESSVVRAWKLIIGKGIIPNF